MSKVYHAWYSEKAAQMSGCAIWRDANGREVMLTVISEDLDYAEKYLWDDKVYQGEVCQFVRSFKFDLEDLLPNKVLLLSEQEKRFDLELLKEFRNIFSGLPVKKQGVEEDEVS